MSSKKVTPDTVKKSWLCMFSPSEHGYKGTPQEIVDKILQVWIENRPQGACAVSYCETTDGIHHCFAVFKDIKSMRFSAVRKLLPHAQMIEGSNAQAEDYVNRRGEYARENENVIYVKKHGDITSQQGNRSDIEEIVRLIEQGKTPSEIFDMDMTYLTKMGFIRRAYFYKRDRETPVKRDVRVIWHLGESGAGKSFTHVKMTEEHGEDYVYFVPEYSNGFDSYNGEPVIFMDELRGKGQLTYARLLSIIGDAKPKIKARYANVVGLWSEVHITSVFDPKDVYDNMVDSKKQKIDTFEQLKRRITTIVYHYRNGDEYCQYEMDMKDYENYNQLIEAANNANRKSGVVERSPDTQLPSDNDPPLVESVQTTVPETTGASEPPATPEATEASKFPATLESPETPKDKTIPKASKNTKSTKAPAPLQHQQKEAV